MGLKKLVAVAALALVAGVVAARLFLGREIEVVQAVRREVVQAVVATGRVESPFRVDVGAQVVGTVTRVPVEQGSSVAAGQTLIELFMAPGDRYDLVTREATRRQATDRALEHVKKKP